MPEKENWINNGWGIAYADMSPLPLWEFGFGLSYTSFEYSNLQIIPGAVGTYGEVLISVDVKNTGERKGNEVVQLYLRDLIASVTVPVKELKGFEKIMLEPGGKKTVQFSLNHEALSFYNQHMELVVEPGTFKVMVGSSSEDIRLRGNLK